MKLLNHKSFQDNYYTRREWVIRLAFFNINDNKEFHRLSCELYNLIKLKNELKKYLLLKTLNYRNLANKIIENQLDYCILSLNNIITNNNIVKLNYFQRQKEKEIVKHRIQTLKRKGE